MSRNSSSTKSRANSSGVRLGPVPPPAPVKTKQYEIHPAQPSHSGPGFLGSVVQGFGLGMGSSLGHRATDAIFGEKKTEPPPASVQLVSSVSPTGGFFRSESGVGEATRNPLPTVADSLENSPNNEGRRPELFGSCEKLLHKYRDCMCGEFFHCDQIYDEYFVCIQQK